MASGAQAEQEVVSLQNQKGLVVSSSDGMRNPVTLWANSSTHRLLVDIGTPTIVSASESDGLTGQAIPAYASYTGVNSGGNLVGLAYGQGTMANSLPVVLASNQSSIPVTGTFYQATQPVSGTVTANQGSPNTIANAWPFEITDGTNTANILKSDGTAAGQNALITAGAFMEKGSLSAGSLNADLVASLDVSNYKLFSIQISGTWSGTLTFQGSNDNTNWFSVQTSQTQSFDNVGSSVTSNDLRYGYCAFRFLRIRMTSYSSGTANGVLELYSNVGNYINPKVFQDGTWTVGSNTQSASGIIVSSSSNITTGSMQGTAGGLIPVSIYGTYAGVSFSISVSDNSGTQYYNVPVYDTNANCWRAPGATLTPGTNASNLYWVPVPAGSGGSFVKVLASAYSTGTANVRIGGSASPTDPGSRMSQIMDSAGNNRGANVDTNNNLNTSMNLLDSGNNNQKVGYGTGNVNLPVYIADAGAFVGSTGSGVPSKAAYMGMISAAGNLQGLTSVNNIGDGGAVATLSVGDAIYNGSSWDRIRSASSGQGTTGTGVLGAAALGWDGTNYQRLQVDSNKNLQVAINGGLNPSNTALNTFSLHSTSNATTTPTASTAYISSITISNEVGGTTSTITIQDKQGTPLKLVNGLATTALTTAPTIINFQTPVKMVGGIDIITAGAVAATVDVWINYYQ